MINAQKQKEITVRSAAENLSKNMAFSGTDLELLTDALNACLYLTFVKIYNAKVKRPAPLSLEEKALRCQRGSDL